MTLQQPPFADGHSVGSPLGSTGRPSLLRPQILADFLLRHVFLQTLMNDPYISQKGSLLLKWLKISDLDCNLPRADFGHLALISEVLMDVGGEESEQGCIRGSALL